MLAVLLKRIFKFQNILILNIIKHHQKKIAIVNQKIIIKLLLSTLII